VKKSRSGHDKGTAAGRLARFGDWDDLTGACQSGTVSGGRAFFAGESVYGRMDLVRQAINDIRSGWEQYPAFMQDLREYLPPAEGDALEKQNLDPRFKQLFASSKEWLSKGATEASDDYSAIRLYTSDLGYRSIFGLINKAFRDDGLTDDRKIMRTAAFVVELLTIDLYNYRETFQGADNYEGTVYRGMCVSSEQLKILRETSSGPVTQRYVSIPLAMISTSTNRQTAMAFSLNETADDPDKHPLLWKIHVASMDSESLHTYRGKFSSSIVTSLCAVPIDRISDYHSEGEVLLRGPFFQITRFGTTDLHGQGKPINEVEVLMLNSNRDHITAVASNKGEDRQARDLFRALITIRRSTLCAEYALERGISADLQAYRSIISQNRKIVDSLI